MEQTETILGNWFAQHGQRDKVFLASKIAGPGFGGTHIRDGHTKFNSEHISQAIDGSLKRLKLIILIFINYIGLNAIPTSLERSLMVISKPKMITILLP